MLLLAHNLHELRSMWHYRAMFLLMDGTLMRGDDTRRLQLCDLFWHPVRQVRPHQGYALGAVTDQGKTNRVRFLLSFTKRFVC